MSQVLVIGGSGRIGREVATQLAAARTSVRIMTRDPDTADVPPDAEIVRGDLTVPESLDACARGVDAIFLVWTAPQAAVAPALARLARGARRIVFLSAPIKTPHPFFQASLPNPMSVLHEDIEQRLDESGAEWTILRPGMFSSNALMWWAPQIQRGDVVRWPYLSAPTAPIDERDVASVAARVLLDDAHVRADYVLTGPESLTQREQLSIIGDAIGRSLTLHDLPEAEARREWAATWPAPVIDMLMKSWAAALGQPAYVTDHVATLTGTPARTFRVWASEHAGAFRAHA